MTFPACPAPLGRQGSHGAQAGQRDLHRGVERVWRARRGGLGSRCESACVRHMFLFCSLQREIFEPSLGPRFFIRRARWPINSRVCWGSFLRSRISNRVLMSFPVLGPVVSTSVCLSLPRDWAMDCSATLVRSSRRHPVLIVSRETKLARSATPARRPMMMTAVMVTSSKLNTRFQCRVCCRRPFPPSPDHPQARPPAIQVRGGMTTSEIYPVGSETGFNLTFLRK